LLLDLGTHAHHLAHFVTGLDVTLADVIGAKGTCRDTLGFPVALDGAKGLAFVEAFLRSYRFWRNLD
jgi:hypothetical protein